MSHGKQGQKQMKLMAAGDILATWVVNSHWKIYLSRNAKKTAFCICETEAVIAKLISAFDFALTPKSMPPAVHPGLCLTLSETQKAGFLMTWLIYFFHHPMWYTAVQILRQ